ncbi:MAG: chemotaxis protein CheB [Candidatus Contendobacter sp.]|nr:chemotaxis protein CheB [Candidatus Contendobacter sp.]MDG4556735.1 chemotaxis protein CheB [Candidatus Contendobacter sp.]
MVEKIKVLVVDDAAFMVKAVSELLESDPGIKIVGNARNGLEGLEKIKALHPDVVTLDMDMPVMDGVTTIRHIMIEAPVPVVVLSSLFSDGGITFEALRLGVVDFLPKPSGAISHDIHRAKQQLIDRVKLAAVVSLQNIRRVKLSRWDSRELLAERYRFQSLDYLLAIGTTLGGPNTSLRLMSSLSPRLPAAAVIVQEISPKILPAFVKKFDEYVPWKVEVARDGTVLEQGVCYVSSYENTITFQVNSNREICLRVDEASDKPLDALFASAANIFERHAIGLLLTGIGNDGTDGFAQIKRKAGATIAQEVETCVYPNLIQCAIERGVVDRVVSENQLPATIAALMENAAHVEM